jgi:8-oxo-dGTP pyrophosphatase MutT (NUDIX family)
MSDSPATATPPAARLAATILLLRDGEQGMEVFMVVRHQQIDFASGALVFPGGKLAPGDTEARTHARCSGVEGLNKDEIALRVGAIREAFEESGILLARPAKGGSIGVERLAALGARYRRGLDRGEIAIADMLETEDLVLDCGGLVPFAHWVTPTFMPKRFDTYFFLAVAPTDQVGVHDGHETVDSAWLTPPTIVLDELAGRRTLVPATMLNVKKLGFSVSVKDALAAAKAKPIVTVQPVLEKGPDGKGLLRIPEEAGYGVSEFTMDIPA